MLLNSDLLRWTARLTSFLDFIYLVYLMYIYLCHILLLYFTVISDLNHSFFF